MVSAFATAYAMKYILGYDGEFSFEAAVMFGALISATDPVAVVSLLKDLGASRTLSTLIEGESLINDGTAFVMFTLCIDLVKGESFDFLDSSILFVRLSLGGPLLGLIMGVIVTFWLTRIVNNSILETNLTIVAAYLTFYFAETWGLEVSGILALVGLGLYMTKEGRTKISHLSEETLHEIWTYLGFACETGVFVIAGTIISHKVFQADHSIGWKDWVKLVGLYIILHVIRFTMVLILRWPLSKIGYGLSWSQAIVLGYSGLRGAVSLILAVIVYLDTDINEHIRDIVLFQTAGIALMTLFINGSTMKFLVTKLGMMRMTNVKKKMLKNIIKAYRKEVGETIDELKSKKNFGKIDWEALKLLASSEKIRDTIFKQRAIEREENDMIATNQIDNQNIMIDNAEYSPEELYIEAKHRYLTTLKGIYWDFFSNGQ